MKYMTLVGADPGKNNFALSVVRVLLEDASCYKVVESRMVSSVITDLTDNPRKQALAFRKEMLAVCKTYNADVFVAERFQNRGRFSGNTGELVSMMLGVMMSLPVLDVMTITAAQWKNAFNRVGDLDQLYKDSALVPHRVDSTSIALYGASQYLKTRPFEFLEGTGQRRYCKKLNKTL